MAADRMTPEREQQIRELAEMSGEDSAIAQTLAEVDRLREFERRVTEELEEFEDAAKADPNTPRVARLMIAALQHAVRGGA
ncbi:hypothetical protein [Streptomyces sp. 184]|uniref:hypothetical protein n=1 Tax=Streptomyces sp. 184 TaxID=1827526 RepID=UPI0038915DC3